jgi:hypothetical protein
MVLRHRDDFCRIKATPFTKNFPFGSETVAMEVISVDERINVASK